MFSKLKKLLCKKYPIQFKTHSFLQESTSALIGKLNFKNTRKNIPSIRSRPSKFENLIKTNENFILAICRQIACFNFLGLNKNEQISRSRILMVETSRKKSNYLDFLSIGSIFYKKWAKFKRVSWNTHHKKYLRIIFRST